MKSFLLVSATGMLGSGFRAESLDKAISLGARMIGCDAGSTDPAPGPLATGTCLFSAAAVRRDTEIMMTRALKAGIPLIIGSAGTSGSDAGLAWMVEIVRGIAREAGLHVKLAVIHSELSLEVVRRHLRDGRVRALPPSAPLGDADIDAATHIVGMRGAAGPAISRTRCRRGKAHPCDYRGFPARRPSARADGGTQILEERVNNGRHVCWVAAPDGAHMELIEKV